MPSPSSSVRSVMPSEQVVTVKLLEWCCVDVTSAVRCMLIGLYVIT